MSGKVKIYDLPAWWNRPIIDLLLLALATQVKASKQV